MRFNKFLSYYLTYLLSSSEVEKVEWTVKFVGFYKIADIFIGVLDD